MEYQGIIFDLDGTLIDSAELTGQIIDAMLAERGAPNGADRDLIRAMDAVGGEAMIGAVMNRHTGDPAADLAEFRSRHRVFDTPACLPFPGVTQTLARLTRTGIPLAICSNKPQFLCEKIVRDLGLARHFAAIVGSDPSRPRKPDPANALIALAHIGIPAAKVLFCGDSPVDVATAKAAGTGICLVGWGYATGDAIAATPGLPVLHAMEEVMKMVRHSPDLRPCPGLSLSGSPRPGPTPCR